MEKLYDYLSGTGIFRAKEFPSGFPWLNVKKPLSLKELSGCIIVLDFWTYCCINCIHMVREFHEIEQRYKGKPVIVIGVHSAKFSNEQDSQNIENAIQRYGIEHPVIVDQDMKIWKSYGVMGWPTLVVIDPAGVTAYKRSGENQVELLKKLIDGLIIKHSKKGDLAKKRPDLGISLKKNNGTLSYPGKISFSPSGKLLAISDSNHNRVLIVDLKSRKIKSVIGGKQGSSDGTLTGASFFRPQGVTWSSENTLYVADTENHLIREIDLKKKRVRSIAGTGKEAGALRLGGRGNDNPINSPWDLAYDNGKLYVAMAGTHQIWVYDTRTLEIRPFAGSAFEGIADGIGISATFSQPSGLALKDNTLYVADSEASAVRSIEIDNQKVRTIIGKGLFVFGFVDGDLRKGRLQHPIGLCAAPGGLYVADTYNHAVRFIDLKNNIISTVIGKDENPGVCRFDDPHCDSLALYEPNDVKLMGKMLYIADTNNHLIRTFDLDKKLLGTFELRR